MCFRSIPRKRKKIWHLTCQSYVNAIISYVMYMCIYIYIHTYTHKCLGLSRKQYTPNCHVSAGTFQTAGFWSVLNIYRQKKGQNHSKPDDTHRKSWFWMLINPNIDPTSFSSIPKILTPSPTLICSNFSRKLFVKTFCCLRFGPSVTSVTLTFGPLQMCFAKTWISKPWTMVTMGGPSFLYVSFLQQNFAAAIFEIHCVTPALKQDRGPGDVPGPLLLNYLLPIQLVMCWLLSGKRTKRYLKTNDVHIYVLIFWRINPSLCRQKELLLGEPPIL